MTIPRRYRPPNQPAQSRDDTKSPDQQSTGCRPGQRGAVEDAEALEQQLAQLETRLFGEPLPGLARKLSNDIRLGRTWSLIEKRYADNQLTLDAAARESGMSRDHLNETLQRNIGLTFHQALIRYRLIKALAAMKMARDTALDAALEAGFGSLSAFERACRRVLGMAPREFREDLARR